MAYTLYHFARILILMGSLWIQWIRNVYVEVSESARIIVKIKTYNSATRFWISFEQELIGYRNPVQSMKYEITAFRSQNIIQHVTYSL